MGSGRQDLLSFIEWATRGLLPSPAATYRVHLAGCSSDASERALQTDQGCPAGAVLVSVPWCLALSSESALERLRGLDKQGAGLLPQSIGSLTALLSDTADKELLPPACAWVLLLALHLLCDLRDPRSRWARYVRLLPAPPGSLVAVICSEGPPASDLLLFSAEELEQLQNAALAASVDKERLRLTRLHSHLLGQPGLGSSGRDPAISLESFVWAHCLVRSRALDLTAKQGGFHERCMLPLIDMCNHDSNDATCRLRVRLTPSGQPRAVDLVAARDLAAGEPLTLNYGERPMRDLLRGYGFTPAHAAVTDPSEVFENLGDGCQALNVQGSRKGRMFRLTEVQVLPEREAHPLLELADTATLCFEVRNDYTCLPDQARGPACIAFPAQDSQSRQGQGAHGTCTASGSDEQGLVSDEQCLVSEQNLHAAAANTGSRCENGAIREVMSSDVVGKLTVSSGMNGDRSSGEHADVSPETRSCDSIISREARHQESHGAERGADVSYREGECRRALGEILTVATCRQGMAPETEQAVVLYLASECRAFLQSMPTDAAQDEALLQSLCGFTDATENSFSTADAEQRWKEEIHRTRDRGITDVRPSIGGGVGRSSGGLGVAGVDHKGGGERRQRRHMEMAVQYRLQRKLLLARVADDLAAQAALLS